MTLDTSEYEEGLEDAGGKGRSFADSLKSGLATAAKVGGAALGVASAGVVALTKNAIEGFAEYEQLTGGVETLFKSSADTVMGYAENAYKTAGLTANEYMETVTSFSASLLQSLGGDTEAAAKYADQAITAMSDNANKMGTDMSLIQNAYQGFAKQNYTMLDNLKLGYGGTQEEMQRLLADAQAISGVEYDISSYADVVEAIHVIQTEMGIAGTTAKEASATISGSFGAMKSAWQNLVTGLANGNADVSGMIDALVETATTFAGNIMPVIETALTGIGSLVAGLGPIIAEQVPAMIAAALPSLVQSGVQLLSAISTGILQQLPMLLTVALDIVVSLANDISASLPKMIPTIVSIVTEIVATLTDPGTLGALIDAAIAIIIALADGIIASLPQLISQLPKIVTNIVTTLIENAPKLLQAAIEIIAALALGLIQSIPDLVAAIPDLVSAIVTSFTSMVADFIGIGKNIVDGIKQGIIGAWDSFTSWVGGKFQGLVGGVKGLLQIASPSKVFAEIGGYMAEGLAVGWNDEFDAVKGKIEGDMNFETASVGVSVADRQIQALNGLTGAVLAGGTSGGTYQIIVRVGENDLAEVLFDPLRGVIAQRGESFA